MSNRLRTVIVDKNTSPYRRAAIILLAIAADRGRLSATSVSDVVRKSRQLKFHLAAVEEGLHALLADRTLHKMFSGDEVWFFPSPFLGEIVFNNHISPVAEELYLHTLEEVDGAILGL